MYTWSAREGLRSSSVNSGFDTYRFANQIRLRIVSFTLSIKSGFEFFGQPSFSQPPCQLALLTTNNMNN